ncbi:MAG TPA: hypothetical protein VIY96_11510 [Thermoanaerobaculia bacterium]
MKSGYLWLASFAIYPLVGAPVLRARAFRIFGLPTRIVLSTGVGIVLVSWTMTLFALLRVRWGPPLILATAAIAFALSLMLKSIPSPRVRGEGQGEGRPSIETLAAYGLTSLTVTAALLATLAARSTSPDLLLFWGPKAQQFAAARTIDVDFLTAPFHEYVHVYYPPLVPNVFALPAMIAGRFPWGAATLTFPLLLAATAIGISGTLRAGGSRLRAAATTSLVTGAIALVGITASVAGNAEPFLLFFELLGVAVLLVDGLPAPVRDLLAGLLFAGAATAKVEGLPFVGAAAALFVLFDRDARAKPVRSLLLLLGPSAVALGTWFVFGATRGLFRGYKGYGSIAAMRLDQAPQVLHDVAVALWKAGFALPWIVPLAVLVLARGWTRRSLFPIATAAALTAFALFTYLTTEANAALLVSWSGARVLSPVAGLIALSSFCGGDRR